MRKELIEKLQSYKTQLCKGLGYRVSLYLKNGEIQYQQSPGEGDGSKHYAPVDFQTAHQSFALVYGVDRLFEPLGHLEKIVIFHRYIDHDWEKTDKGYRTLTHKQIAEKLGATESTVRHIEAKALSRMLRYWHKKFLNLHNVEV